MTKNELVFYIETQTSLEFTYKNKKYNLTYDKDDHGNNIIVFGPLYEGIKFNSIGDFFNNAKIENHFFKEMLDIINIK